MRHSLPTDWKEESVPKKMRTCLPKSLLRLYSKNSLKRNLCQTNSSRNIYQKVLEKNISTTNSLRRILYKAVFKRNLIKIHLMKNSTQKTLYQKIFEDKIRPTYVWRRTRYQTICEGQLSTKQTSNRNLIQTNFKGNLYQRVFGKTCLPQKD